MYELKTGGGPADRIQLDSGKQAAPTFEYAAVNV